MYHPVAVLVKGRKKKMRMCINESQRVPDYQLDTDNESLTNPPPPEQKKTVSRFV
jgi:hypothetical protein